VKNLLAGAIVIAAATGGLSTAQAANRDSVSIVGSSTVYPFATVVAERFGRSTAFKTPKVESTGSGGGLKLFCKGVGVNTPDIANASRRIKQSEYDACQDNGVTDIVEALAGYDGIVIANTNALGIFGFSFLDENGDKVQGTEVDGVVPTFDSISSGDYPVSRPLYFYIKSAHVGKIPGIAEYAMEFTSSRAMGEDGYLPEKGLIPLSADELQQVQADVKALKRLEM
jgi:ABC-type phosphate transport system substrate-binding protein